MAAFAFPLLRTTVEAAPPVTSRCLRDTKTGAAVILFDVKTAAAGTGCWSSVVTNARSSSLLFLIPLATPLARKPSTSVIVMGLFQLHLGHQTHQALELYLHIEPPGQKHPCPDCLLHKMKLTVLFLGLLLL